MLLMVNGNLTLGGQQFWRIDDLEENLAGFDMLMKPKILVRGSYGEAVKVCEALNEAPGIVAPAPPVPDSRLIGVIRLAHDFVSNLPVLGGDYKRRQREVWEALSQVLEKSDRKREPRDTAPRLPYKD